MRRRSRRFASSAEPLREIHPTRAQYTPRVDPRACVASAFRRKNPAASTAPSLLLSATAFAHDIPASVVVQTYLRPQGQTLHVLVRAPLAAMRDAELPLRGDGRPARGPADRR